MEISSVGLEKLNRGTAADRLAELERYVGACRNVTAGEIPNDHIHTFYSFSRYSPAAAVLEAKLCGFRSAGIADHDSVSGAREFTSAGELLGIPTLVGCECRVDMTGTEFSGRRLNSSDQTSLAYVVMHDIPSSELDKVDRYLRPLRKARLRRDADMCEKLSSITSDIGIRIDLEKDVLPLSHANEGGSVTERHIVLALAGKLLSVSKNDAELSWLLERLGVKSGGFALGEPDAEGRLMSVLKAGFVERFYIPAKEECQNVRDFIRFCGEVGAVPAYAYLGDVSEGKSLDKKPQKYEDDWLDLLIPGLKELGFGAVTYIPCRNTKAQIARINSLCDRYRLLSVTGCESPCGK